VGENTTLLIDPGTNLKFWQPSGAPLPGLRVRGLLKAEEVKFTSVYDSRELMGGVTYSEARDPQPGDWAGITFVNSSSRSYLRRSVIQYAGHQQGAIAMQASSPELSQLTIADSAWYPLSADADSFPTLVGLTLTGNDPGDALEIRGGSSVSGRQERTWQKLGDDPQIIRVIRGEVTVDAEATLIIEPGVIVKFEPRSRLVVRGTLQAVGGDSDAQRIVFTSLRDSDYGGRTDKNTSPQDPRTWDGIVFDKSDDTSTLQNVVVRYGSVAFNDASPRLIDNVIRDSESAALWASPAASPLLRGNQLQNNEINGLAIWEGRLDGDQVWSLIGESGEQLVRVLKGRVTVTDGATLQIEPGVIIMADAGVGLVVNGGLRLLGESNEPVIFTSLFDDDTSRGTSRSLRDARAGDWPGIEIGASARISVGHATIRFAQNGLYLRGQSVPIVTGMVQLVDGQNAVRCDAEVRLPTTLLAERNESNVLQCPHR
jgi:hypothetical protein